MTQTFEQLRSQYGEDLSALICRKVKHDDKCHDILQELYLKLIENPAQLENVEYVLPYLKKMASNLVTDYYRRQSKISAATHEAIDGTDAFTHGQPFPPSALSDAFLWKMIEELPRIYRIPLILSEMKGISQKDVALQMGMSYSGLRSRIQRGKKMLKQSIQRCCDYKFDRYGNVVSCCGEACC